MYIGFELQCPWTLCLTSESCYVYVCVAAGYNYYGTEQLYSGVDGRAFEADIFIGVVYYQRLRHMVSDKFQVSISV